MAFALGRSSVTSRTAPRRSSLTLRSRPCRASICLHHPDERIAGDRSPPPRQHEERIDVELDEPVGIALREVRDGQDRLDRRSHVAAAACPGSPRGASPCAGPSKFLADLLGRDGQEHRRRVLEELDQDAAGADRERRPELRVPDDADDQLGDRALDHALDQEAVAEVAHMVDGVVDVGPRAQAELDAADVGLMGDRVRMDLQGDRKAERGGGRGGLDGRREAARRHLQAVAGEEALRIILGAGHARFVEVELRRRLQGHERGARPARLPERRRMGGGRQGVADAVQRRDAGLPSAPWRLPRACSRAETPRPPRVRASPRDGRDDGGRARPRSRHLARGRDRCEAGRE